MLRLNLSTRMLMLAFGMIGIIGLQEAPVAAAESSGEMFPVSGWQDLPDPLASEDATPGGAITFHLSQEPSSFNNYLDSFNSTRLLFEMMYESLLKLDSVTIDDRPNLASKWSISADKKTFTFWIDPRARWSDGRPVTAHDVKATFDAIMASPRTAPRVCSPALRRRWCRRTHRLHCETGPLANRAASALCHLPSTCWTTPNRRPSLQVSVTSAPIASASAKRAIHHHDKRQDWWQHDLPRQRNKYNFDSIKFKFFAQRTNALEAFKKGEIDIYAVYTSRIWWRRYAAKFEKTDRQATHLNRRPQGFQGFVLNMRREPYTDARVRRALGHLLDREKMNRLLMYNVYQMQRSYFGDLFTADHPTPNPYVDYNVDKARTLLQEAGWAVNPKTGKLEKDGVPFVIHFLGRSASFNRFLAIYSEGLKQVGIDLKIDMKDLAAWAKDVDAFNFDMTLQNWGAALKRDPEQLWSSAEADRKTSSNIPGFKHPRVDALIEQQRTIFDVNKRNEIYREIDGLIFQEYPYLLLWNADHVRLLYWNKFGTPDWVLDKYYNEYAALKYWWLDEDARDDLEAAQADGESLPRKPLDVKFDVLFEQ